MGKATFFYIFAVLLAIVGIWAIIRVGNTLKPPRDVSGTWMMTDPAGHDLAKSITLNLSQSGKYLVVHHPGTKPMSLVLASDEVAADQTWQMDFQNSSQQLIIRQAPAPGDQSHEQWALITFQGTLNETLLGKRQVQDVQPANAKH